MKYRPAFGPAALRRAASSLPASAVLAVLGMGLGSTVAHLSWLQMAGLGSVLLIATSVMHGVSTGRGDGADRLLLSAMLASLVTLVSGLALGSASSASAAMVAESLGMLAVMLALASAIASTLGYAFYMAFHFEPASARDERFDDLG